jgi:hypothetical protein
MKKQTAFINPYGPDTGTRSRQFLSKKALQNRCMGKYCRGWWNNPRTIESRDQKIDFQSSWPPITVHKAQGKQSTNSSWPHRSYTITQMTYAGICQHEPRAKQYEITAFARRPERSAHVPVHTLRPNEAIAAFLLVSIESKSHVELPTGLQL